MADGTRRPTGDIGRLLDSSQPLTADFRSLGTTGLRRFGGYVFENALTKLTGREAARIYKEMGETDPSCGIILFLIQNVMRGVEWFVQPASENEVDVEAAEFVESCLNDLDVPFTDVISEHLSMIQYGFSVHEIVYKRRCGRADEPWMRSKYTDGRIAWRGLPIRSQDTVQEWLFDDAGSITGVVQLDPCTARMVRIPAEKMLLFRTSSRKNNPEGVSAFLRAHRPWYLKRGIENCEAVGLERDLAGLPMAIVDASIMSDSADEDAKSLLASIKDVVTRTRRDEQEGIVFPRMRDENGNDMFEFKLLSSGGARQFDTSKIIERYDQQILRTALADFLTLGQGSNTSGSWAMHSDKSQLFVTTLKTYSGQILEVYNRHAIPRLMELNGFAITDYPKLMHTPIESVDVKELTASILSLAQSGFPLFPNPDVEKKILELLGLPVPSSKDVTPRENTTMPAYVTGPTDTIREIPADEMGGTDAGTPAGEEGVERPLTERIGNSVITPARKSGFDEGQHPRAEDGKFSEGGGGGGTGASSGSGLSGREHMNASREAQRKAKEASKRGDEQAADEHRREALDHADKGIAKLRQETEEIRAGTARTNQKIAEMKASPEIRIAESKARIASAKQKLSEMRRENDKEIGRQERREDRRRK